MLNGIWVVCGCPGGWHGPYEEIPSNFGQVWSYRTWGKTIFLFLGRIGNSLYHQIPPNWSSGLQIGFWISPKARGFWLNSLRREYILKMTPKQIDFMGKLENLQNYHCLIKWFLFYRLLVSMGTQQNYNKALNK